MKIFLLCKRYYTNKDLINDHFGRLYHLPKQLAQNGATIIVNAIDYRNRTEIIIKDTGVTLNTLSALPLKMPLALWRAYCNALASKSDIIIASGDIYIGYVGFQIARRLRVRFVFDVYDYYPAFRINQFPGLTSIFKYTVKNADLVLCASESLKQTVLDGLNKNALLIENGVDQALFAPGDQVQARQMLNLSLGTTLIGYFGSITPTRGPLLIEACRKIRETMPSLQLMLAGRLTEVGINESWIHYLGELAQQSIPTLIHACDVVCVPYAGDTFNQMSGACKIAEYLACGKPVVATRVSSHEQIFKGASASLCAPNSEDMALAILSQLSYPQSIPFPENLSWKSIGRRLHNSLAKFMG